MNSAININLKLDARAKMSVRVACRLGLADIFLLLTSFFQNNSTVIKS